LLGNDLFGRNAEPPIKALWCRRCGIPAAQRCARCS